MREPVTLIPAAAAGTDEGWISAALTPDLFAQVRRRVRALSLLLLIGFGFDLVIWVGRIVDAAISGGPSLAAFPGPLFQWTNAAGVVGSAAMWWVAGRERISASRLFTLGQAYEILICLAIALSSFAQHYQEDGIVPHVTWVMVVVILFPLLLPGPPRRVLFGAIAAAAMGPLALWFLHATGQVLPTPEDYVSTVFSAGFAVMFATVGANVVYGLGREVAAARRAGSYRLEERLGEGGMGEVWRARHRMLARPAAIKLIRRAGEPGAPPPSSELLERFEREAQVIASLRSPHTIDLFDFGVADDGAFYYAMELLEGLDGETLVRRFGPLPADRVVHLLLQVCHSLSEAHARGLVHRDIKPGNVFVCRYGEEVDFVKVLDFGIVKELDRPGDDPALTADDAIRGTPAFLSPEQALGSALDGRCDIYAVGCLAYWFLTGTRVFEADTTVALLMHHLKSDPERPSIRTELSIPPELEELVLACLAKEPADRPESAHALAERLRRVPSARTWDDDRAQEWWALHRPLTPASA